MVDESEVSVSVRMRKTVRMLNFAIFFRVWKFLLPLGAFEEGGRLDDLELRCAKDSKLQLGRGDKMLLSGFEEASQNGVTACVLPRRLNVCGIQNGRRQRTNTEELLNSEWPHREAVEAVELPWFVLPRGRPFCSQPKITAASHKRTSSFTLSSVLTCTIQSSTFRILLMTL